MKYLRRRKDRKWSYFLGFLIGYIVALGGITFLIGRYDNWERYPDFSITFVAWCSGMLFGCFFENIQNRVPKKLSTNGFRQHNISSYYFFLIIALYCLPMTFLGVPWLLGMFLFVPISVSLIIALCVVMIKLGFGQDFPRKIYEAKNDHLQSIRLEKEINKARRILFGTEESEGSNETNTAPDYLTGYKYARPIVMNNSIRFQPITFIGQPYSVDDIAHCSHETDSHPDERVPVESCHCGFYGMFSVEDLIVERSGEYKQNSVVLLECDFFGKIVPGTKGLRAEKQRILKVSFSPYCQICCSANHSKPFFRKTDPLNAICVGICDSETHISQKDDGFEMALVVISICEAHMSECTQTWSLQELADQIGTEVGWQDPIELS